ncbi:MAG: hypothetical protein PVG39_28030 [Desulfobacteraceae bacterium]
MIDMEIFLLEEHLWNFNCIYKWPVYKRIMEFINKIYYSKCPEPEMVLIMYDTGQKKVVISK